MKKDNLFVQRKEFYQVAKEEAATYGSSNIGIKEMLAILIGSTADMETCAELASMPSDRLISITEDELRSIYNLSSLAAQRVVAALSLTKKIEHSSQEKISSPQDMADALSFIKDEEQENFVVLLLDTKNKIKKKEIITKGLLNSSLVHPREVFKLAIREGAASIAIGHNHPSGNPEPSQQDISVTKRLISVAETIGIPILDHVIVGKDRYVSFKERGFM